MGFLDSINLFKKKEDFPPFEEGPTQYDPPHQYSGDPGQPQEGQLPSTPAFSAPNEPSALDDHRMGMPLGDNMRQGRIEAMHGPAEQPHFEDPKHNPLLKELELISSKLDYLRASLEAVNQRLANLEHSTRQEVQRRW